MMNDELMPKREGRRKRSLASTFLVGSAFGHPLSSFVIPSSFVIREFVISLVERGQKLLRQ